MRNEHMTPEQAMNVVYLQRQVSVTEQIALLTARFNEELAKTARPVGETHQVLTGLAHQFAVLGNRVESGDANIFVSAVDSCCDQLRQDRNAGSVVRALKAATNFRFAA